jgi:hypothetical protein
VTRPLESLGVDDMIILKWISKEDGVDWIKVAQDRDQLQVL